MSVYNDAGYVETALESILSQTFCDFEFIVVDDGSTDDTPAILDRCADPRVVRLRNEGNLGLARSLNRGLAVARGEYVARQDADDASLPDRLARQVQFLDSHPKITLVGTGFERMDEQGRALGAVTLPTDPDQIHEMLFYSHCFCHGSVLARRTDIEAVDGYDERFVAAQDTDLWLRLAERFELANLPDPLYRFRLHAGSVTGQSGSLQRRLGHQAAAEALARCLSRPGGWRPTALTLGRFFFSQAVQALEDGCADRATEHLIKARETNPRLDADAGYLARLAVYRAFERGPARTSRLKSACDVRAGLIFLQDLFELVPRDLDRLRAKRRWAVAELHAAYAFAAFEAARPAQTARHCLRAWYHDPGRLRQRGLLSIFGRSLLGSRQGGGRS